MSGGPGVMARAWRWSLDKSPLIRAWSWIRRRDRSVGAALAILDEAALPVLIDARIRETIRRTRLWSSERAEITREFVEHARDALDAGEDPERIVMDFGDAPVVARLVTRAARRKRPTYWKMYRAARRVLGAAIVLVVGSYAVLALRFYAGEPSIETDYMAVLNEGRERYDATERAWPVYLEIATAWKLHTRDELERQRERAEAAEATLDPDDAAAASEIPGPGLWKGHAITPNHPDYDATVALHRAFRPEIDRLIDATSRPVTGMMYSDRTEEVDVADGVSFLNTLPPKEDPVQQGSLFELRLPHLAHMRRLARILIFDAKIGADEGDAGRVVESHGAVLLMARQLHEEPVFLITDFVKISLITFSIDQLRDLLKAHPDLLTRDQIISLAHSYGAARDRVEIGLGVQSMMFEDLLQRAFTDNGNGNGRLTPEGLGMLSLYSRFAAVPVDVFPRSAPGFYKDAASPLSITLVADRRAQRERFRTVTDAFETVLREGPASIGRLETIERQLTEDYRWMESLRYQPVLVTMPALLISCETIFRARTRVDAGVLMLALEVYRTEHGAYPGSLHDLPPRLIPEIPEDPMDPGSPLKYARTDTGYVIYSVGSDGDDDSGRATDRSRITDGSKDKPDNVSDFSIRFARGTEPEPSPSGHAPGSTRDDRVTPPDADWILIEIARTAG